MNFWGDPARDELCALMDSLCDVPAGTSSECFALLEGEPLTPCVDAALSTIYTAVSSGVDIDEAVENELSGSGVSALCIMASEIPDIVTSNDCPDDDMVEECIADMLESRLRYWFKARCDRFDFWLAVYVARAGIETDSNLADGTPIADVCRRLNLSSPSTRDRARRDLMTTKARGGDVLRYFNFANKCLH